MVQGVYRQDEVHGKQGEKMMEGEIMALYLGSMFFVGLFGSLLVHKVDTMSDAAINGTFYFKK